MVTYCVGSARQKRAYFSEASGVVLLDNVEVIFCVSENGKNCFAYGELPFGSFTVEEYLTYRRALCTENFSPDALQVFRISPKKKIGRLSPAEMRCVAFLEKTNGRTDRALVINLDGAKYTRRANATLKRLLAAVTEAYVCVTDERFLKNADDGYKTMTFGKQSDGSVPKFFAAKKLARRIGAKKISVV